MNPYLSVHSSSIGNSQGMEAIYVHWQIKDKEYVVCVNLIQKNVSLILAEFFALWATLNISFF